jgi:hypothetical protein
MNAPVMFDFHAPVQLHSHYSLGPSPSLDHSSPWIVSADFTDWFSKMPEEVFHTGHMEHNLPVDDLVKVEGNHAEMFCRPADVIPPPNDHEPECQLMASSFPPESLQDFKHVLYNLLAEYHNNPSASTFLQPCTMEEDGVIRQGFRFNSRQNPEKKLPELYAQHIRKARLDCEDQSSVFIQDLYKYYLRACVELLSKYFEKRDKYTYLYDDIPLFVPGETLDQAEERIKTMKTRARKKRRIMGK